jgi:hypothetical protein
VSEILADVMIIHIQKIELIARMSFSLTLYQDCQEEKKETRMSTARCQRLPWQKERTLDHGILKDQVYKIFAGRQIQLSGKGAKRTSRERAERIVAVKKKVEPSL